LFHCTSSRTRACYERALVRILSELLSEMIKMLTVAVVLLALALLHPFAVCASAGQNSANYPEISIPGAPDHGIFDPSIARNGAGKLYMTLSGVASTVPGGDFNTLAVRTYLASSSDQGKTWQLGGVVNPDVQVNVKGDRGSWQSEVSTLAFDPHAPKESRWKLVWHQYLAVKGDRKFAHGWMAYKEAATPEGLAVAKPVKLFIGKGYDKDGDDPAGSTHTPIPGSGVNKVHKMASALEDCIFLSEAGMLAKPEALYMSMLCFKPKLLGLLGAYHHVILLKCARPCDATKPGAWSYAGTVLTPEDAEELSMRKFSASDLFSEGGRDYIAVSPVSGEPVPESYKGCVVFRFADIARGEVERGGGKRPVPALTVSMDKDSFNGACSFLPSGPNKGLLIGRVNFYAQGGKPNAAFHLFNTNTGP
jgi:hypothetical protein